MTSTTQSNCKCATCLDAACPCGCQQASTQQACNCGPQCQCTACPCAASCKCAQG